MRKMLIVLTLALMLIALVSCDGGEKVPESTGTKAPAVTTTAPIDTNEPPTEENTEASTKAPETPLYDWTARY